MMERGGVKIPRYVTRFDSSWGMMEALARYLKGKDFPGVGSLPNSPGLAVITDTIGGPFRTAAYAVAGLASTVPPQSLPRVRAEDAARAMVSRYPERTYPAVMIGSSNGAATHICAAMGAAWLPQTFLIPLRGPDLDPDEILQDMEWARGPAWLLLDANPELQLNHMHDPVNDRLMIRRLRYFRVKRLRLGQTFEQFIVERLAPGGTIYTVECQYPWPTVKIGERHLFQVGGAGGTDPYEYLKGSPRVEAFLRRQGSTKKRWDVPEPDAERPEAEWGFEPALRDDVEKVATGHGFRLRRLVFREPEDFSPAAADFHRWWYREHGIAADRLLVESFIVMDPLLTVLKGLAPFWVVFNDDPSVASTERYIEGAGPFRDIYMMVFSNGVLGIGLATIESWRAILMRATHEGAFLGMREDKYPSDFGVYMRYNRELRKLPGAGVPPPPVTPEQFESFLKRNEGRYKVRVE